MGCSRAPGEGVPLRSAASAEARRGERCSERLSFQEGRGWGHLPDARRLPHMHLVTAVGPFRRLGVAGTCCLL